MSTDTTTQEGQVVQDTGPYTQDDLSTLEQIRSLRNTLIDRLVGDREKPVVPGKTSEMVLLQGLIDGLEKQVHTTTKVKIAAKAQASEESVREEIKHLLLNYREPPRREVSDEELTIPAHLKRPEFKPGALDQGVVNVTMQDLGLSPK